MIRWVGVPQGRALHDPAEHRRAVGDKADPSVVLQSVAVVLPQEPAAVVLAKEPGNVLFETNVRHVRKSSLAKEKQFGKVQGIVFFVFVIDVIVNILLGLCQGLRIRRESTTRLQRLIVENRGRVGEIVPLVNEVRQWWY